MSKIKNVFKTYNDFSIHIPSLEISDSGITALIGPSGAGKTTLFRILIGLESCPGMSWEFKGQDLALLPIQKRKLGIVFQSLELFPHLTAYQNILFAAQARKTPSAESEKTIDELSKFLKIHHVIDKKVGYLSGGEKQRVAIARALAGKPQFLFLDEPFSSLDEEIKSDARSLVKSIIDRFQIPTLLITHDERDVDSLAHTRIRLNQGRVQSQEKT